VGEGDLYEGVPGEWRGRVDLIVGALPYVPDSELPFLAHDVLAYEPRQALEGGPDGLRVLRPAVLGASSWLQPGGRLLLELGAGQPRLLSPALESAGFRPPDVLVDPAGDVRGIEAVWPG
jgi:release factor glutamine methyltransferase